MIVLGIDPGTIQMGWAVMRHQGQGVSLLSCGCFKEKAKNPMAQRLLGMHHHLSAIMQQYTPTVVCLEKAFVGANAASALNLGCVRGVVMVVAQLHGATLQEVAPNAAKKNLTGRGHATKEDIGRAVHGFFGVKADQDAADAVAVAFSADVTKV